MLPFDMYSVQYYTILFKHSVLLINNKLTYVFFLLPNEYIYNGNGKPKHFNFTHNGLPNILL